MSCFGLSVFCCYTLRIDRMRNKLVLVSTLSAYGSWHVVCVQFNFVANRGAPVRSAFIEWTEFDEWIWEIKSHKNSPPHRILDRFCVTKNPSTTDNFVTSSIYKLNSKHIVSFCLRHIKLLMTQVSLSYLSVEPFRKISKKIDDVLVVKRDEKKDWQSKSQSFKC